MKNILTLALAVALPVLMAAQPQSSFKLEWASTGSHCVIGGGPSLEYQKKAFDHIAWRGERVFAQAVISSDAELKDVTLSASDLRNGKSVINPGIFPFNSSALSPPICWTRPNMASAARGWTNPSGAKSLSQMCLTLRNL